jgi:hypothetical protein
MATTAENSRGFSYVAMLLAPGATTSIHVSICPQAACSSRGAGRFAPGVALSRFAHAACRDAAKALRASLSCAALKGRRCRSHCAAASQ